MKISPITSLANNKQVQKAVNWSVKNTGKLDRLGEPVSNLQLVKKHFPPLLTVFLSSLFIKNTVQSKEIPQDKKQSLIGFYTANCAIIVGGTYAIMPSVAKFTNTLGKRINMANMKHSEKILLEKGMKSMIPIIAIGITARVISPILSAYFSSKTNKIEK